MKSAFRHSRGTNLEDKRAATERMEWLNAVEYGFRQCEKGFNLQAALENAMKIYDNP